MKTSFWCASLFFFLALAFSAAAQDFHWEPGTVSVEVKTDHDKLKIGQYLYVTHHGNGAETWNMAKLNLPESWTINSVKVGEQSIQVTTENRGRFEITPKNLGALWNKLRKTKPGATNDQLAEIWQAVGMPKNP